MTLLTILFVAIFLFLWWISTRKTKTALLDRQNVSIDNVSFTILKKRMRRFHISSKRRNIYEIEITTPKQLPQLFIDAHHDEKVGYATEYRTPKRDQAITLEGNFNSFFQAYAPKELHSEVLTLLTPDVMAILIDKLHITDAQTTGAKLVLKSNNKKLVELHGEIDAFLTKLARFSTLTKTDEEILYTRYMLAWHAQDEAIKVGSRLLPAGWFFMFLISVLPMILLLVLVYFSTEHRFKYANWPSIIIIYLVWSGFAYHWHKNRDKYK